MHLRAKQLVALLLPLMLGSAVLAAGLNPGASSEFKVELPRELRMLAGRRQLSPVTQAQVTIAVPANFDAARDWPVLIVNAPLFARSYSSRRLLRAYAETAFAAGWITIAVSARS